MKEKERLDKLSSAQRAQDFQVFSASSASSAVKPTRAVFLDRDGTLIRDVGYLSDPEAVELLPGVVQALTLLRQVGLALVLVSNQSGVGRGLLTRDDLVRVHERLIDLLTHHGIELDGAYYCPHAPWERCECRKPLPGMLHQAARELGLDLTESFVVGDKLSDVAAGRQAGCRTVLLRGDLSETEIMSSAEPDKIPDRVAPNLLAAARWIVSQRVRTGKQSELNVEA